MFLVRVFEKRKRGFSFFAFYRKVTLNSQLDPVFGVFCGRRITEKEEEAFLFSYF